MVQPGLRSGCTRPDSCARNPRLCAQQRGRAIPRHLLWSSIDNDSSRDLDQMNTPSASRTGRVFWLASQTLIAMWAPDHPLTNMPKRKPRLFTRSPRRSDDSEQLRTGLTSLNETEEKLPPLSIWWWRGWFHFFNGNLTGDWCATVHSLRTTQPVRGSKEKPAPRPGSPPHRSCRSNSNCNTARRKPCARRGTNWARPELDRVEAEAVVLGSHVQEIEGVLPRYRATDLIEDFMIAANETMARTLASAGVASIRRVVKTPERWPHRAARGPVWGPFAPREAPIRRR